MSPIWVAVFLLLGVICETGESATIQKSSTIETFKEDLKKIETNVNDFAFDLLQGLFGEYDDEFAQVTTEETVSEVKNRTRRSASSPEDDMRNLCQKYCNHSDLESQQIQDLKREVKNLKQIVELIKDQDDIFDSVKDHNDGASKIVEPDRITDKTNHEELSSIRSELNSAIKTLNQTRGLLDQERRKSVGLDKELKKQKGEMIKLEGLIKRVVAENFKFGEPIVTSPSNETVKGSIVQSSRASSELSEIRKLLSELEKSDESVSPKDSNELIESKISQLEEKLHKKKKQQSLSRELKALEEQMAQDENDNQQMIKQITKLINKNPQSTQIQGKNDDFNLNDLQDAINKLRPKEVVDENQQFQVMINKLLNNQQNFRPNIVAPPGIASATFTPQISVPPPQSASRSYLSNNGAYICFVNEPKAPFYSQGSSYYQSPAPAPPIPDQPNRVQFFQAPPPQNSGNYYAQPAPPQPGPQQPQSYQPSVDYGYQDDLRKQIDSLQVAINSLNRPEYVQRPEDKAMVQNLEYQIADLRNIVSGLNQNSYSSPSSTNYRSSPRSSTNSTTNSTKKIETPRKRLKRDFEDDNKVDEDEDMGVLINKMSKIVTKALDQVDDGRKSQKFDEIQNRIDTIKHQLSGNNSTNPRSVVEDLFGPSYSSYQPSHQSYQPSYQSYQPSFKEKKTAVKLDFFTELVAKIMDKVVAAIPVIIKKLFNFSLESLFSNDVSYDSYGYGYGENDMSKVFKNLGVFGLIPALLLRVINGLTAFVRILKKNKFFSRFLLPVVVLGVVAGAVLFLIWWLQPEDAEQYYQQNYNQNGYADPYNIQGYQQPQPDLTQPTTNYQAPNYQTTNYQTPNNPVYSRSYYNARTNTDDTKLNK